MTAGGGKGRMIQLDGTSGSIAGAGCPARRVLPRLGTTLAVLVVLVHPARAEVLVETSTGIRAVIHTTADVADLLETRDGRVVLPRPGAGAVELDTSRFAWDTLTPVPVAEVVAALEAMHGFTTAVGVDVYLLPGFPTGVWSSFSQGRAVYLAPTFGPTPASTIHYVVTHEMGHVLTSVAFDPLPSRWEAYLSLRGLDASALDPAAPHAERAREILAEDLRCVFGGPLATISGTIENARLPLPQSVYGLTDLLAGYLSQLAAAATVAPAVRAFPNPCNPQTTVEMSLPSGAHPDAADAMLTIFDVRGHLVQRIHGAEVAGGVARTTWRGDDDAGRPAPSGLYVYEFTLGGIAARGRVSVVR
jgi:hypothetical protein